jgi:large subunit ribosomal protein L5
VAPRLKATYDAEIVGRLMTEFSFKNVMQVPKVEKVILNFGLGEAVQNPKVIERVIEQATQIAGQKPVVTRAAKSIANFKLREGMPIGVKVTLRRDKMWEFLDRLINVALPRVRDFRGVSAKAFDGRGNYTLGIREQIIFPEIDYDKVDRVRGMNITVVTTGANDDEGRALLRELGMPFRK